MTDTRTPLAVRDAAHLIHPVTAPRDMATEGAHVVVSGDGCHVIDDRGRRIIDGFAGLWCVAVGHGRTEIQDAVNAQMKELEYFTTFHGQSHPRAIELAEKLASMFTPEYGLNHVMFSSGGSEANETNIKIARLFSTLQGQERRTTILARNHGYHGLTIATMTATGIHPLRWGFGPDSPGFVHGPAPWCYRCELDETYPECNVACAAALDKIIEREGPETVAAIIAEPVIGAGGIIPPPPEYFPMLREICDRHGILLIIDEVVTGFGRTGTMFGHEHWGGIRPDMVTLAKGLTSGYLPLGASVISDRVWDTISERLPEHRPFSHGFTYSGHPVCCAAALANIEIIEKEDLAGNAARVGEHLMTRMRELERFDSVGEVRGMGLMIGVDFVAERTMQRGFAMPHTACAMVEQEAWERGLYARAMGMEVVGLAPPLVIDNALADEMVEILADSIEAMERELMPAERTRTAAAAADPVDSARDFFERVLPKRLESTDTKDLDPTVQFALTGDDGGTWLLTVGHGSSTVDELDAESADATITLRSSAADYLRIANAELSVVDAFSAQRMAIEGDMGKAAALATLGLM